MKILDVPAIGSTSVSGSHIDKQRLINLYPVESKGRALKSVPGLEWVETVGNGPHRGFLQFEDDLIIISGSAVYRFSPGYHAKPIGSISDSTGRVVMFSSGIQLMIIDGNGRGWTTDGNTLSEVTDLDFKDLLPTTGVFHDGYAVVNKKETGEFYISTSYDFSEWNPLDFATAESYPDDITHIETDKSLIWVFGKKTLEVYQNTGNADFPFEVLRSVTSHFGALPKTIERLDNTLCWLAQNEQGGRVVVRLVSNADPQVISDEEINTFLASIPREEFENVETASLWWQGHPWYVLTFKTLDTFGRTLVFDLSTGACFEWSGRYASVDTIGRIPFSTHVYFNHEHLVGDWDTGDIYRLSGHNLNGEEMLKERQFRAIRADGMPLKFPKIEAEMNTGNGTDSDTIALSLSFDGGRTWGNVRTKSIGAQGEYSKRVTWWRNGQGRNTVIRLRTTADRQIEMTALKVMASQ